MPSSDPPVNKLSRVHGASSKLYFVRAAFLKVNRLQKIHRYEEDTPTKEDRDQMRNQKKKKSETEIIKGITENVTILWLMFTERRKHVASMKQEQDTIAFKTQRINKKELCEESRVEEVINPI